jgi:hypothetical protein
MRIVTETTHHAYVFDIQGEPDVPEKMLVWWGRSSKRTGVQPTSLSAEWVKDPGAGWQLKSLSMYANSTRKGTGYGIRVNYTDFYKDIQPIENWMVPLLHPVHPNVIGL